MEFSEIAELENKIAFLKEDIVQYRNDNEDGVERRKQLVRMQMKLGEYTRRLRTLKGLS
jgi:uncharacterized coiled-coil protein SlyX